MRLRQRPMPLVGLTTSALLLSLALAPATAAHSGISVGEYLVEVGWRVEPAFVGQPNGIQVTIHEHHDDAPVTDLDADALSVVVTTAGVDSPTIPLAPAFDAEELEGPLGEYGAPLVPTSPGDYTFHIVGAIHDTAVDLTITSGEETFDAVEAPGELEFPIKQPTLLEVATRLDRIDGRITELQGANPGAEALAAANAAADAARTAAAAADQALLVGSLVGGAGVVIALIALVFAARAARRGAGTA